MIDQEKKELRKKIKALKSQYSLDEKKEKSIPVFDKIEKLESFQNAKTIMVYWSMDDEVFTHDFILKWQKQKQILLPVVKGADLELREFIGLNNMKPSKPYGILEPQGEVFYETAKIDIIIVPGVAFDKNNNRMGRGKAYYDKLLKTTRAVKIGVCFDFQMLESVPVDEHDIKMDMLITE